MFHGWLHVWGQVKSNSFAHEQNLSLFPKVQTTLELSTWTLCDPDFQYVLKTRLCLACVYVPNLSPRGSSGGIQSDLNVISVTKYCKNLLGVMMTKCGAVSVENWSLISCRYSVIFYQVLETWNKLEDFAEPLDVKTKARINLSVTWIINKRDCISCECFFFHCI